jgi:hypothetical protein
MWIGGGSGREARVDGISDRACGGIIWYGGIVWRCGGIVWDTGVMLRAFQPKDNIVWFTVTLATTVTLRRALFSFRLFVFFLAQGPSRILFPRLIKFFKIQVTILMNCWGLKWAYLTCILEQEKSVRILISVSQKCTVSHTFL